MPNLTNYRLPTVFIFHKTGDEVVLPEPLHQLLLLITSALWHGKLLRSLMIDLFEFLMLLPCRKDGASRPHRHLLKYDHQRKAV